MVAHLKTSFCSITHGGLPVCSLLSCPFSWEGGDLTQTAQETFDGRIRAVISRQHSRLVWFALQERHGKTFCDCGTIEKC